jgi:hypothetical protein
MSLFASYSLIATKGNLTYNMTYNKLATLILTTAKLKFINMPIARFKIL